MTKLFAIATLIALAFVLIRYRANEKLQQFVVIGLLSAFVVYITVIMAMELFR